MTAIRLGLLAGMALLTCACSYGPNPVIARDPIPPPPAGYAVACSSRPFIFNAYLSRCVPAVAPEQVIIRSRG